MNKAQDQGQKSERTMCNRIAECANKNRIAECANKNRIAECANKQEWDRERCIFKRKIW